MTSVGAARHLPASVVETIVERSDGIPIFAEELARSMLAEAAALAGDPDEVDAHAAELRRLTVEHALPFWRGHADLLAGLAETGRAARDGGDAEPGFRLAGEGLDALLADRTFLLSA